MNKWDRGAVLLNAYRVFPRIWLGTYYLFFVYAWFFIVKWFISFDWNQLPDDQIVGSVAAAAIAGFPAIILGILSKILKDLTQSYWNGTPKVADQ
jgi:pilus assembly protein TadC